MAFRFELACLALFAASCAEGTLAVDQAHPASPKAETLPAPSAPEALRPDFDPAAHLPKPAGSGHHHGHHGHGGR